MNDSGTESSNDLLIMVVDDLPGGPLPGVQEERVLLLATIFSSRFAQ